MCEVMRIPILIVFTIGCSIAGCNKATTNTMAPESDTLPTPVSYSISGKVTTPLGPVHNATISLVSYANEACVELGKKPKPTDENKKKFEECWKKLPDVQTNENGEYGIQNLEEGWYRMGIHWRAPLKSNLISGAYLIGEYQLFYDRPKDEPGKFGFYAMGHPFKISAGEAVTKNLFYDKGPYEETKK